MESKTTVNLASDIRDLTTGMVGRIKTGCETLTVLESRLLELVNSDGRLQKDPYFLLKLCQYFRGSVSNEIKAVWDFAVSLRGRMPLPPPSVGESSGGEVDRLLEQLTPAQREKVRRGEPI